MTQSSAASAPRSWGQRLGAGALALVVACLCGEMVSLGAVMLTDGATVLDAHEDLLRRACWWLGAAGAALLVGTARTGLSAFRRASLSAVLSAAGMIAMGAGRLWTGLARPTSGEPAGDVGAAAVMVGICLGGVAIIAVACAALALVEGYRAWRRRA